MGWQSGCHHGRVDGDIRNGSCAIPSSTNVRLPEHVSLEPTEVMMANAADKFDERGNVKDAKTAQMIKDLLEALVEWTRRLRKTRA